VTLERFGGWTPCGAEPGRGISGAEVGPCRIVAPRGAAGLGDGPDGAQPGAVVELGGPAEVGVFTG